MIEEGGAEASPTLRPADIAAYLATSGWELEQQHGAAAEIWRLGRDQTRLLLPRDSQYVDYNRRLADALRLLRSLHEWTPQQLAASILQTRADVLYVRAEQTDLDGSIPLKQADALVNGSVLMLEAAALATVRPRAVYPSRRPRAVTDFVNDDLRMGHTRRGSFIITILTRLGDAQAMSAAPPAPKQAEAQPQSSTSGSPDAEGAEAGDERIVVPTFQRRVMTTLSTGLEAASQTAADARLTGLTSGVDRGASANLYGALNQMTSYEGLGALDLSFAWAPAIPQSADVESTLVFTRDEMPNFRAARDELKKRPAIVKDSITGQVVRLERGTDKDEGVITITGVVGAGQRRNVRIRLQGETYQQAVRAHESRNPVTCSGDIERTGNAYWMRSPVFTVIDR